MGAVGGDEQRAGAFRMEGGRRRGPRRGSKSPDLGVESGRAESGGSALSDPRAELLGHEPLLGRLGLTPDGANSSACSPTALRLASRR